MGYNFRDEIVARSRAMILMGYSGERIAKDLPALFPGENVPAERTVQGWAKELRETALEEIRDAEVSISRRMDAIIHDYLDRVEDGTIKPSFSQVMLGWGLAHDKVTRTEESKMSHPPTGDATKVLIILNVEKPEVVEGEIVKGKLPSPST
jgi:hypothetical protein